jgi:hypothetical protein
MWVIFRPLVIYRIDVKIKEYKQIIVNKDEKDNID